MDLKKQKIYYFIHKIHNNGKSKAICGYITKEEFNDLYKMLKEESCMIASFMKYLGESEFTGSKYK